MLLGRRPAQDLTRIRVVLAARDSGRGWLTTAGLAFAATAIAAAGAYFHFGPVHDETGAPVTALLANTQPDAGRLQQQLEQSRLTLGLSESRGKELERQIDTLNQRLRESQEELTFFRKTPNGKH